MMLEKELASKRFEIKHKRTVKFNSEIDKIEEFNCKSPKRGSSRKLKKAMIQRKTTKKLNKEFLSSFHGKMKKEIESSQVENKIEEFSDSFYFRDENNPDQEDEQKEENDVTTPKSVKQNENKDHNETSQVKVSKYDIKLDPKLNFSLEGQSLFLQKVIKVTSRNSSCSIKCIEFKDNPLSHYFKHAHGQRLKLLMKDFFTFNSKDVEGVSIHNNGLSDMQLRDILEVANECLSKLKYVSICLNEFGPKSSQIVQQIIESKEWINEK